MRAKLQISLLKNGVLYTLRSILPIDKSLDDINEERRLQTLLWYSYYGTVDIP